ncbi:MAG TPA: transposase [Planctomycetota bacterium]|nr:transposase [Planctomycetota bacterium]HRR81599.1 transposase [Planctomycetota bacterium]HRT97721.1 transposase [Planctomycetota bacterium]
MPRIARIVIPGLAHHVTQRGNNRQDVFFTDDDRAAYLALLARHAREFGLRVLGYCLMTNHVHLVAVPEAEDSLARAVGRTDFVYAQAVNRLHGRCGHLWQNRFHSCPLDEAHLAAAVRYAERNPVRARMVRLAWRYPWSSAAAHVGEAGDPSGLLDLAAWRERWSAAEWRELLRSDPAEEELLGLRFRTRRGRPLGSDAFLGRLEAALGRRLRALPVGRPRANLK